MRETVARIRLSCLFVIEHCFSESQLVSINGNDGAFLAFYFESCVCDSQSPWQRFSKENTDSRIIVTNEFREQVRSLAKEILAQISTS
jgi:hypothetical protein